MQTEVNFREHLASVQSMNRPNSGWLSSQEGALDCPVSQQSPTQDVLEPVAAPGIFEWIELILKDRPRVERIIRDRDLAAQSISPLVAIALIGFTMFGGTLALVISSVGVTIDLASIRQALDGGPAIIHFVHGSGAGLPRQFLAGLRLIVAYDVGLVAAAGVCLPSLYFYGLLAGVPMSMARVVVYTLKGMATTATALVGLLPIYMAFSLGAAVFDAPKVVVDAVLCVGLALPFGAGLFGAASLYSGFTALTELLPPLRRCERACLLRRLIVSWSVCYAAVMPVMIFTLWEYFSRIA